MNPFVSHSLCCSVSFDSGWKPLSSGVIIGEEGVGALVGALEGNSTLLELNLGSQATNTLIMS